MPSATRHPRRSNAASATTTVMVTPIPEHMSAARSSATTTASRRTSGPRSGMTSSAPKPTATGAMTTIWNAVDRFSHPTAITIVSAATAVAYDGTTPMRNRRRQDRWATARITAKNTARYGT